MPNNTSNLIQKLIDDQERIGKLSHPFRNIEELINPANGAFSKLAASTNAFGTLQQRATQANLLTDTSTSASIGNLMKELESRRKILERPMAEVRRIGILNQKSDFQKTIDAAIKATRDHESAFKLPARTELDRLIKQATEATSIASTLAEEIQGNNSLHTAMKRMTQPWLNIEHAATSMNVFARLASIGQNVSRELPFGKFLSESLRPSLGDWRELITIDENAMINPLARSELYLKKGLDESLTNFPVSAFHEGASIVGLTPSEKYFPDEEMEAAEDDVDDIIRAEQAFAQLRRFEMAVRAFIAEVMEKAFGEHWIKQQLPKDMREKWEGKRQAGVDTGREPCALIEYADFSDYRMIIERKDNWNTAFKSVFGRPEDVRESFQRLNPIRISTMHSRIVTLNDELLLMVETKRVLKAIGIK